MTRPMYVNVFVPAERNLKISICGPAVGNVNRNSEIQLHNSIKSAKTDVDWRGVPREDGLVFTISVDDLMQLAAEAYLEQQYVAGHAKKVVR